MKVYYSPGACSLSPHIVAREAGLPLTLVRVDTKSKKTIDGDDYRAINGKGYVPLLELDDGTRLTEGPAIVQYLADRVPPKQLAPANGTIERYKLQEWLNFITSEIHKQFSPLFDATMPDEMKTRQRDKLAGRFDWLAAQLGDRVPDGSDVHRGRRLSVHGAQLDAVDRDRPFALAGARPLCGAHRRATRGAGGAARRRPAEGRAPIHGGLGAVRTESPA